MRPAIPVGKDHILVPLSVRSSETNKDFVSRELAYYDCTHHDSCGDCVRSAWACNWCVYENRCTHNVTECRKTVVSGENVSILRLLQRVSTKENYTCYEKASGKILKTALMKSFLQLPSTLNSPFLAMLTFPTHLKLRNTQFLGCQTLFL